MALISDFSEQKTSPNSSAPAWVSLYVCPKCKGSLPWAGTELRCCACGRNYPVRHEIPDFIVDDWRNNPNWSLRHFKMFDWLAPIYETNLWYPVVIRLSGVKGIASLPELLTTVEQMTGTVAGSVLDVACGPGTFGRRIAAHSQSVYGIDISLGMLEQGRAYAEREHIGNLHFSRSAVESLPFAGESFAATLCCGSLHLFQDPAVALREIARTLRPGASFVGVTFAPIDSVFSRFALRHGARLFEVGKLGELLSQAGFVDYSARTFGSALIFSTRKSIVPDAGLQNSL
jgi:ubiquinone/menaquinone biosynthesis C-methylase UbiE/uncharacterized protein YbaR (Trm112 family)